MKHVPLFRLMIVVSVGLAIVGEFLDWWVPGILPAALDEAYAAYSAEEFDSPVILGFGAIALFVLIAGLASTIGLFLLKPWSRRLALWVTVLTLVLYPPLGASLYSGWSTMLLEASVLLWGAVLAMAYFSELKVHFEK